MTNEEFVMKVLRISIKYDAYDDLIWSFAEGSPFFRDDRDNSTRALEPSIMCSDTFDYACADCEPITEENIDLWELSLKEAKEVNCFAYGSILFVARQRKMSPLKEIIKQASQFSPKMGELLSIEGEK